MSLRARQAEIVDQLKVNWVGVAWCPSSEVMVATNHTGYYCCVTYVRRNAAACYLAVCDCGASRPSFRFCSLIKIIVLFASPLDSVDAVGFLAVRKLMA